jgi:cytochrome c biogenesis protein CcmG/thiol:disulfide interchange protein DsbE
VTTVRTRRQSWLRWLLVPVVVLPVGWLLLSGFGRDPREVTSPLIGRAAPAWSLETLEGETLSSDELAGRPYVVNFWASWCGPCVDEHPVLTGTAAELGDDLAMVGVLYQDEPDDARAFLGRYGDTGYAHVVDADGRLAIDFGVTGPPETFFVDADGIVRDKQFGPLDEALMDLRLGSVGLDR